MKKVFITGAGSGLGFMASIELARRGHTVYASVHYQEEIGKILEIRKNENLDIHVFLLNILNEEDRNLVLNYDIDVFISNSAIGDSGSVADIDISRIEDVFKTNVFCNLKEIQLVLKGMINIKHTGRIVFLSSLVGRIPMPFLSPYCASKFALECFATCLKQEMKLLKDSHIEVCLIEPGAYATGFNQENIEKKYRWMKDSSYFSPQYEDIKKNEKKVWDFLEQQNFQSIVRQYVRAVEDTHPKFRYTAPWWQAFGIQLLRIFGQ